MPLAQDRPPRPQLRKIDAFISPEHETERKPFEGFLKRELTKSRVEGMLHAVDVSRQRKEWGGFSRLVNGLAVIVPGDILEFSDDETFDNLVRLFLAEKEPYYFCAQYLRTLEMLFPHRRQECQPLLQDKTEEAFVSLRSWIDRLQQEGNWKYYYEHSLNAIFLKPNLRSEFSLNTETAKGLAFSIEQEFQNFSGTDRISSIKFASALAILQPELKSTLPFSREFEQAVIEQIRFFENCGAIGEAAWLFESVAILSADRVDIPSPGRLVLHQSESEPFSFQPSLPPHKEY